MREIKFRGKSLDNGMMVYGNLSVNYDGTWIDCGNGVEARWVHVDPETVGQYIGINEGSNDDKWYEGDILSPNPHLQNQEIQIICYDSHQAKYKGVPLSAYLINAGNGSWTGFDIKYYQRRKGNIHDNPELLAPKEGAEQ